MKPIPETLQALIGHSVAQIDTPALVVDLDAMERNIARMAAFARQHGMRWRPHAKLHKSAALALQLEQAGAIGHCVQKISEAEALAAGGVNNIFISNEVIAPAKLTRVAQLAALLAKRGGQLAICVDSEQGIAALAQAMQGVNARLDVLVEIDVGQGRCGVAPGVAALPLARAVLAAAPQLHFAGLQAYRGNAQHIRSVELRHAEMAKVIAQAAHTRDLLENHGIAVPLVTGSGTGTLINEAASGVYGELQPGSFLFMDADYAGNEPDPQQPPFEHALFVKTQVMSRAAQHAVCDAGHKAHAIDSGLPKLHGLAAAQALSFANGGDEHGVLHADAAAGNTSGWLPALGDTLWLIPGHCDPTVNLHDYLIGVRGGLHAGVVEQVFAVDGRGALS